MACLAEQAAWPTKTVCGDFICFLSGAKLMQATVCLCLVCIRWSQHLLACLCAITGAVLLVRARTVTFNPHFHQFYLPPPSGVEWELWTSDHLCLFCYWICLIHLPEVSCCSRLKITQKSFEYPGKNILLALYCSNKKIRVQLGTKLCVQRACQSQPEILSLRRCSSLVIAAQSMVLVCNLLPSSRLGDKQKLQNLLCDFHWREGLLS